MNKKTIGRLATVLAAVFWGTSFPIINWGLRFIDAYNFVLLRFSLALLFFLLAAIVVEKSAMTFVSYIKQKDIFIMGILNGLAFLLQFLGQELTTATKASLLVNSNVIFVAILSAIFLKERMDLKKVAGVILALAGVFLIITNGDWAFLGTGSFMGDLIVFLTSPIWGIYIILNKKSAIQRLKAIPFMSSVIFYTTLTLLFADLFFSPIPVFLVTLSPESIFAIVYTALFTTLIAFLLWYEGLKWLNATSSSLYLLLEVLVAAILSVLFLSEQLVTFTIIGGILLGIGIYLSEK